MRNLYKHTIEMDTTNGELAKVTVKFSTIKSDTYIQSLDSNKILSQDDIFSLLSWIQDDKKEWEDVTLTK